MNKHVPDAHGNCSRWCDHTMQNPNVPTHDENGNPLTRDGHVISAQFPWVGQDQWVVFIYPNHTDMRHPWEPACGYTDAFTKTTPCDLRVNHESGHAYGSYVNNRSTLSYDIPEMEQQR